MLHRGEKRNVCKDHAMRIRHFLDAEKKNPQLLSNREGSCIPADILLQHLCRCLDIRNDVVSVRNRDRCVVIEIFPIDPQECLRG